MFDDFWSRQQNKQTELLKAMVMGIPAHISSNRPDVMSAVELSLNRFSTAARSSQKTISLTLVVRPQAAGPVPNNLPERMVYSGVDDWITVSAGLWGHGFANLASREAVIFLSPELASSSRLVSRYFVDHYLLNFVLTDWAMLHASCVLSPDMGHLIIMIAAHNTGKSTTAFHLLRAGFPFLADGMALVKSKGQSFEVGGYPIGEVKLRDDVLGTFPAYSGQQVQVREQTKTVIDLRLMHSADLVTTTIRPEKISLCFLSRSGMAGPTVEEISPEEAQALLAGNSVYWDKPARIEHNGATLRALVERARLYRLWLGEDVAELLATFERLF